MYRACIYCNRKLGGNEVVENFPVGRRLAFDQEKGRLWVVCERCRRWNLSPLDERWEAIEECEKRFRDTKLRLSTDNIGLARLREGLELVRIGRPLRPEFAAWRYGKHFLKRRISRVVKATAQAIGYVMVGMTGIPIIMFFVRDENSRVIARVRDDRGNRLSVVRKDLKELELVPGESAEGWSLNVPYRPNETWGMIKRSTAHGPRTIIRLDGSLALNAAGRILPRINSFGATGDQVKKAVDLIEHAGAPEHLFAQAAEILDQTRFTLMNAQTRLALEMAAHEETERRAFEGELAALEAQWREAEEVAAIADRLLMPSNVNEWLEEEKRKISPPRSSS
jgi:hypothetical protein